MHPAGLIEDYATSASPDWTDVFWREGAGQAIKVTYTSRGRSVKRRGTTPSHITHQLIIKMIFKHSALTYIVVLTSFGWFEPFQWDKKLTIKGPMTWYFYC